MVNIYADLRVISPFEYKCSYTAMDKLRWIVTGVLGGIMYAWLVTLTFAKTFSIAWPEWYQVFAEDQLRLGTFLWNVAMELPAVLFALSVGFILTKVVGKAALPAAFVGAVVSLIYVASSSASGGWINANTFIIAGLLPLSVFVLAPYNKSLNSDAGDAGAG
ncbi:MAG: hypothetical protein KJO80_12840 [Gammaproteobacteria bacterium]|nr:hypothetical protein [Gammaproteobacteria bacterium]